jgi:hypothetical protein
LALKSKPNTGTNKVFYREGVSESDYIGDKDTRTSVYGYDIPAEHQLLENPKQAKV